MTKELIVKPETVLLDLIDQIKAASVETFTSVQEALIGWHHAVGAAIIQHHELLQSVAVKKQGITGLVRIVAEKTGKSERALFTALAFARKYPTLESLPPDYQGKNVSFAKIRQELLAGSEEMKALPHLPEPEKCTCEVCGNTHNKKVAK